MRLARKHQPGQGAAAALLVLAALAGAAAAQSGELSGLSKPGMLLIYSVLVAFLILLLLLIINVLRNMFARPRSPRSAASPPPAPAAAETPLQILNRRYASGEIPREQYEAMKRDLQE